MNRKCVAIATFVSLACGGSMFAQIQPDGVIEPPGPRFNLDQFEINLITGLRGKSVGYAYAITQNGRLVKSGAYGMARTPVDMPPEIPGGYPQSPNKRMNIASITKPMTATLVHKIIQDKLAPGYPNLTLNSPVGPFLPKSWIKGPGVATLTFAELLSQYTGMWDNDGKTGTDDLKLWIQTGVTRPKAQYIYINANLAIFRVIIPYLLNYPGGRDLLDSLALNDAAGFSTYCGNFYKQAMRTYIFTPIGLTSADMKNSDPVPTLLYNVSTPEKAGTKTGDWTEVGAGGGWYFSAVEIARFIVNLRYNNAILTPETRALMTDLSNCPGTDCRLLGWQPPIAGAHGVYYYHSGSLSYGAADPKNGMRGAAMNFPNNTEVVLLINSIGTYGSVASLLSSAYDAAWQ